MDPVNLYDTSYSNTNFLGTVHERVRLETYGEDLGQTSWMTADECREFIGWLGIEEGDQVLDVGSGAGNVALFIATTSGASVLGIDINENAVATARESARRAQCVNNLHQIGVALESYHSAMDEFPMGSEVKSVNLGGPAPAATFGADGVFRNGFIMLLPFMEQQQLSDAYDENRTWYFQDAAVASTVVSP